MAKARIPKDINEAIYLVHEIVNAEKSTKDFVKNSTEREFLSSTHHGFGRWIRNNWGLWDQKGGLYRYFINNGLGHADDMSSIILTSFHRYYNGKSMDIDNQIEYYKEYWRDKRNINPLTQESY